MPSKEIHIKSCCRNSLHPELPLGQVDYIAVLFLTFFIASFNIFNLRDTISADFNLDVIPNAKEISIASLIIALSMAAKRLIVLRKYSGLIIPALFILIWFLVIDHYQSKIFDRADSQLSKFPIFVFLGFYFALSYRAFCIYFVVLFSWVLISASVILFSMLPEIFVQLSILSDHFLNSRDPDSGIARNSGILLNNNSFGSIHAMLTISLYKIRILFVEQRESSSWVIIAGVFISFLAGNATSLLLLAFYFLIVFYFREKVISLASILRGAVFFSMAILLIYVGVDTDYAVYKLYDSGFVKFDLFANNIGYLFDDIGFFLGNSQRMFWSESSLINALYDVGVFQFLLFMAFLLSFAFRIKNHRLVMSVFMLKETGIFFFLLFLVSLLQNSAFMVPAALVYGFSLGLYSKVQYNNRVGVPGA